mmetsp:Transcript_144279/g.462102  ORF Transcript_144279/g.462102 Transcript_144279/m.462102 type:complete len:643 (+) Transcript_144279:742-2670(+)
MLPRRRFSPAVAFSAAPARSRQSAALALDPESAARVGNCSVPRSSGDPCRGCSSGCPGRFRPSAAAVAAASAACPRPSTIAVSILRMSGASLEITANEQDSVSDLKFEVSQQLCLSPWNLILLHGDALLEEPRQLLRELPFDVAEVGAGGGVGGVGPGGGRLELSLVVSSQIPSEVAENTERIMVLLKTIRRPPVSYWSTRVSTSRSTSSVLQAPFQPDSHSRAARKIRERRLRDFRMGKGSRGAPPRMPVYCGPRVIENAPLCKPAFGSAPSGFLGQDLERCLQEGLVDFYAHACGGLLHFALRTLKGPGLVQAAALMLAGGTRINAPNRDRQTAVHVACRLGRGCVAERLLGCRANACLVDANGHTALDCAMHHLQRRHPEDMRGEEDFALARVCCALLAARRTAAAGTAACAGPSAAALTAARAGLAQAALELALFCPPGSRRVTRAEVWRRATPLAGEASAFENEDLWQGWPWAFLSFSEAVECERGCDGGIDRTFASLRKCLVGNMLTETSGPSGGGRSCVYRGCDSDGWRSSDFGFEAAVAEAAEVVAAAAEAWDLQAEHERRKERNLKWRVRKPRRSRRVPWATAPGGKESRSSRLARRLPSDRKQFWGRKDPRRASSLTWSSCDWADSLGDDWA